jgi:hypothetical protein
MSVKTELDQNISGLRAAWSQLGYSVATSDGVDLECEIQPVLDVTIGKVTGQLSDLEARTLGEGFSTGDHSF